MRIQGAPCVGVAPEVSVCVPVYNGARYVAETMRSILSQSFEDFELIVTDNCSTDDTVPIVRDFEDPRIRLVVNDANIGAVGNFNKSLREARGRRVKIVCADDLLDPDCLAKQVSALDQNDGAVLASCARRVVDHRGRRWITRGCPSRPGRLRGGEAVALAIRSGTNVFGEPVAVMMDRDAVVRAGGFSSQWSYCLDIDLWCRLLLQGDAVIQKEALCSFRVSPGAWSTELASTQAAEFERFVACTLQRDPTILDAADIDRALRRARLNGRMRRVFYKVMFALQSE